MNAHSSIYSRLPDRIQQYFHQTIFHHSTKYPPGNMAPLPTRKHLVNHFSASLFLHLLRWHFSLYSGEFSNLRDGDKILRPQNKTSDINTFWYFKNISNHTKSLLVLSCQRQTPNTSKFIICTKLILTAVKLIYV